MWPGALHARRTRTMKLCSSDARSKGQPWPLLLREVRRIGRPSPGLMARPDVPEVGVRVRKPRAVEDNWRPPPWGGSKERARKDHLYPVGDSNQPSHDGLFFLKDRESNGMRATWRRMVASSFSFPRPDLFSGKFQLQLLNWLLWQASLSVGTGHQAWSQGMIGSVYYVVHYCATILPP